MTVWRDATETAAMMLASTLASGGSTVSPRVNGATPTDGYMVGVAGYGEIIPVADLNVWRVIAWINRVKAADLPEYAYLGSWLHDGRIYFDVSLRIESLAEAAEIAEATGELAVFDLASAREIAVAEARTLL